MSRKGSYRGAVDIEGIDIKNTEYQTIESVCQVEGVKGIFLLGLRIVRSVRSRCRRTRMFRVGWIVGGVGCLVWFVSFLLGSW